MSRWPTVSLGTAVELAYGKSLPKGSRVEGGSIPVYGSNGITGWHDTAVVDGPAVIVGRKGSAGAVQFVDGPCFPIDTTYYARPRAGFDFDIKFLFYLLRQLDLSRLKTATGVPGLTREDAYRETVPVPALSEQRRIVDLLSRAEGIVRLRREAEKKAAELIPALFLDVFGDPATNPKGWPMTTIGSVASYTRYGPRFPDRQYSESGAHILRTTDMGYAGELRWKDAPVLSVTRDELRRFALQPGTLLVTRTGATIGKIALFAGADEPCIAGAYLIEVGLNPDVIPEYVLWHLLSNFGQSRLIGGSRAVAQPNLNAPTIREIPLPLPPLALQREFVARLTGVQSIQTQQTAAASKAQDAFDALLVMTFKQQATAAA